MSRVAITPGVWRKDLNRAAAVVVLKTAYRETYPDGSADTIIDYAQKVEQRMFEKARSKLGYDDSVFKAADAIRMIGASAIKPKDSTTRGATVSTAGRFPKSPSRKSTPSLDVAHLNKNPVHEGVKRVQMIYARKSLTPISARVSTKTQKQAALNSASAVNACQKIVEGSKECTLGIDASDVIKLVPFILEAAVQVIGVFENPEQARNVSESDKSSIGFLSIEKMSRAFSRAGGIVSQPKSHMTSTTSTSSQLKAGEKENLLRRADMIRAEYLDDIKTIYALLRQNCDLPQSDEWVILNVGNCLKKLDELEDPTILMSKQTQKILDSVEKVFKGVIEQYCELLSGGRFQASRGSRRAVRQNCSNDSHSSGNAASSSDKGGGQQSKHQLSDTQENPLQSNNEELDGSEGSDDDAYIRYQRSHLNELANPHRTVTLDDLKIRHAENIGALAPLVEVASANLADRDDILNTTAYVQAFLDLKEEPHEAVLRSAERIIEEYFMRWSYLLLLVDGSQTPHSLRKKKFRPLSTKVARKTAPIVKPRQRPAKMTVPGPKPILVGEWLRMNGEQEFDNGYSHKLYEENHGVSADMRGSSDVEKESNDLASQNRKEIVEDVYKEKSEGGDEDCPEDDESDDEDGEIDSETDDSEAEEGIQDHREEQEKPVEETETVPRQAEELEEEQEIWEEPELEVKKYAEPDAISGVTQPDAPVSANTRNGARTTRRSQRVVNRVAPDHARNALSRALRPRKN